MLWVMECQEVSNVCLHDVSIAFDTEDHDILLSTLNMKFELQDIALQCFGSYLLPRHCIVKVGESYLSPRSIKFQYPKAQWLDQTYTWLIQYKNL